MSAMDRIGHAADETGAVEAWTRLFNKYMLPKAALTVISIASLAGAFLTAPGNGSSYHLAAVAAKWFFLLALALMIGGEAWRRWMALPALRLIQSPDAQSYFDRQAARFDAFYCVASRLLPAAALGLTAARFPAVAGDPFWFGISLSSTVLAFCVVFVGRTVPGTPADPAAAAGTRLREAARLGLPLALLGLEALVSVRYTVSFHTLTVAVRFIHLTAFSLWFGGAVWNIFVAVPAARGRISFSTAAMAHYQLERFRAVVRLVFPLILLTGLHQADSVIGLHVASLAGTAFGQIVLFKLGLIVLLFGIFLACPMWRACSPVTGMCKLEDYQGE